MKKLCDYKDDVLERLDYNFNNIDLLYQAFTRSSYAVENGGESNEVLEFIGDRVLDYFVTREIASRYGFFTSDTAFYDPNNDYDEFAIRAHKNEKDFTELKKELVSNKNLADIISALGWNQLLIVGKSDVKNQVWKETKVMADLFEAIIGAVAVDCNYDDETLTELVVNMLDLDEYFDDVDDTEEYPDECKLETAINTLKELFEHGYISEPKYTIGDEQILYEGEYKWTAECYIRSHNIEVGAVSDSKKGAKRYAAYLALCKYHGVEPVE